MSLTSEWEEEFMSSSKRNLFAAILHCLFFISHSQYLFFSYAFYTETIEISMWTSCKNKNIQDTNWDFQSCWKKKEEEKLLFYCVKYFFQSMYEYVRTYEHAIPYNEARQNPARRNSAQLIWLLLALKILDKKTHNVRHVTLACVSYVLWLAIGHKMISV